MPGREPTYYGPKVTYARRAVSCGPRRWELQDPRDRRNEHALTRTARKRTAPRPGGAPDRKGSGDGAQMALCKAAVRRVGGQEM
eukprot:1458513-Prymnesium_polylepis.1